MLNIILGAAMINFLSGALFLGDYRVGFACGGMGGVFARIIQLYFQANPLNSAFRTCILGSVDADFARWFWHFWAGVFVWGL
ncbi:energy-coupled thiamine transporter ThiT, partial [Enterococcus faecalis]|uniref:energy-coupled thiamine transporter ThiT n=1 Tax=Enterococcus faecalis TaxID=1351 RepID=UPI003CC60958